MVTAIINDQVERWDVVILGSGEAGKFLAWRLGAEGKRVAMIERKYMGGSCPNIACLPSKSLIHSAQVAWYARNLSNYGLPPVATEVDMRKVIDRKRRMVGDLVEMHQNRYDQNNVTFIWGTGRFRGPRLLEVTSSEGETRLLLGEAVVISTGTRANVPDIPGLVEASPLTHVEALELERVPRHLVILGAGFVALEFAQAMRRLGGEVTVLSRNSSLLPSEDEDVSTELYNVLVRDGIRFLFSSSLISVDGRSGEQVELLIQSGGCKSILTATHILIAAGRRPNTEGIGLEAAGVELTPTRHIQVNERLETTARDTYAVGECAGSPYFTHIAYDDHRVVFDAIHGGTRSTKERQVPYCLFTDPEVGHVGLRERDARKLGIPYRLTKLPIVAASRTRTLGETTGFFKALIDENDLILGFTVVAAGGGELLAAVQMAMSSGLPCTSLRDAIFAHPTLNEGLVFLFSAVPQK